MESISDPSAEALAFEAYLRRPTRRRLASVVRLCHERVWKLALRFTGNEEDAADVSQDLFLALLLNPPKAEAVRSPRGYLAYRVLTLAVRADRGRSRRQRREVLAAQQIAARAEAPASDVEALENAIRALPERVRTILELRYFAELRNGEIATILGVSERTIEDELHRGRETLRERLGAEALGGLALLARGPGGTAPEAAPPPAVRGDLLRIVRKGDALAARCVAAASGGLALKKLCALAVALLLCSVAGFWISITSKDTSKPIASVVAAKAQKPPERVSVEERIAPKPATDVAADASARDASPVEKEKRPIRVAGWVVDERGEPVAGARVEVFHVLHNYEPPSLSDDVGLLAEAITGAGGEFLVTHDECPQADGLTLVADKPGFARGWARPDTYLRADAKPVSVEGVLIVLPSQAASLEGSIVDEDGRAIEGATVRAAVKADLLGSHLMRDAFTTGPGLATTDRGGRFIIEGLPASAPLDVLAEHPGFLPRRLRQVIAGATPLEVRLERGATVRGRVVDVEEKPVAGTGVSIYEVPTNRLFLEGTVDRSARTGEDGTFQLEGVRLGTSRLVVSPPANFLEPEPEVFDVKEPVPDRTIVLEAGALLEGVAKEQPGEASLPNVPLIIRSGGRVRSLRSSRDGSFRCAVHPGSVEVFAAEARDSDYKPAEAEGFRGDVETGETLRGATVWFVRRKPKAEAVPEGRASVLGTIVDPGGRPVVAAVAICPEDSIKGFSVTRQEAVTGPDGKFSFNSASFPFRLVAVSPARLLHAEMSVDAPSETDFRIVLEPYEEPRVEGVVVGSDGSPVPDAGVIVTRSRCDILVGIAALRADGRGHFVASGLFPDTYYHFTAVLGAVHGPSSAGVVAPGKTLDVRCVLLDPNASLSGVIRDTAGRPLAGMKIDYDFSEDELPRPGQTVTRSDGTFEASGLFPGKYQLYIDEEGYGEWHAEIQTSDPPLEIELAATRTIRFDLRESSGLPVTGVRVSGETTRAHSFWAADGRYAADVPEAETRLILQRAQADEEPKLVIEIDAATRGDLDLGTLELKGDSEKR